MHGVDAYLSWVATGKATLRQLNHAIGNATGFQELMTVPANDYVGSQNSNTKWSRTGSKIQTQLDVETFQSSLRTFLKLAPEYPGALTAYNGIVIPTGGIKYLGSAIVTIRILRERFNSSMAIQLVTLGGEQPFGELMRKLVEEYDVEVRCLENIYPGGSLTLFSSFSAKLWALALAPFQNVLLVDSDAHPVVDPERLLHNHAFRKYGAVLWPDYWPGSAWKDLLKALGIANSTETLPANSSLRGSHESGQILIDRHRKWRSILVSLFLVFNSGTIFERTLRHGISFGAGDKELLPLSFATTGESFYKVPVPIASIGDGCNCTARHLAAYESVEACSRSTQQNRFSGHTMAQNLPSSSSTEFSFVHRNCLKLKPALNKRAAQQCHLPLNNHERLLVLGRVPDINYYKSKGRTWFYPSEMLAMDGSFIYAGISKREEQGISCRVTPHGPYIRTARFFPDLIDWDIEYWMERYSCELAQEHAWKQYVALRKGRFKDW